jgi:hypothetical protein
VPAEELYQLADNTKTQGKQGTTSMEALYQAYGLAEYHADDGKVIPDVIWAEAGSRDSLIVNNTTVTRGMLQQTVKKAIKNLSRLLHHLLLSFPVESYIPSEILDDFKKTDLGYCFHEDPRNLQLKVGSTRLLSHFMQNQQYSPDGVHLNKIECEKWIANAEEALELLCFLIHTTCGEPARATEVACLQYRNSGDIRHFFFHGNRLVVRPGYNKSDAKMQKGKYILRFFEDTVKDLFIRVVSFVRPLEMSVSLF